MKRILLALTLFQIGTHVHASYVFRNNANNINTGTLPNGRLDPSSVTLQTNNYNIAAIVLTQNNTNYATSQSTTDLVLTANNSNYMELSNSTQTKIGGISANGNITSSNRVIGKDLRVGTDGLLANDETSSSKGTLYLANSGNSSGASGITTGANSDLYLNALNAAGAGTGGIYVLGNKGITIATGKVGIGLSNLNNITSALDISGGSITVRGTNAGISVQGATVAAQAVSISSFQWRNIAYNPPATDGSSGQILATNGSGGLSWATDQTGGGGGGNNQLINTSTDDVIVGKIGGAVFLATSPFVPIPNQYAYTGKSTWNVTGIWASIAKPSTATDSNIDIIVKVSTSGDGLPSFQISSATIISSSGTTKIYSSNFQSTSAVVNAYNFMAVQISSVSVGAAPPGEDIQVYLRRFLSP